MWGNMSDTMCLRTKDKQKHQILVDVFSSLSINGKQVHCAFARRQFFVMPEIREIEIAECGCHIG